MDGGDGVSNERKDMLTAYTLDIVCTRSKVGTIERMRASSVQNSVVDGPTSMPLA